MIPQDLLAKIRLGARTATLLVAMGGGVAMAEEAGAPPQEQTQEQKIVAEKVPSLTKEQLDLIKVTIPKLGDADFQNREKATATLTGLGTAGVPPLKEALAEQKDAEVKSRLQAIIKKLTEPQKAQTVVNEDPCPACGRG